MAHLQPIRFENELLLQQAISGLLSRMPDVANVRILQGSTEFGKDIVFDHRGPFGERIPCACVVKNEPITGNVSSNKGARTVLMQAQQCMDTGYTDANGDNIRVQRVFVMSSHPINETARQSIAGALREAHGTISFYGVEKLFELFKTHWPDFLADEANAIAVAVVELQKAIALDEALESIGRAYRLPNAVRSSSKMYVRQTFSRRVTVCNHAGSLEWALTNLGVATAEKDGVGNLLLRREGRSRIGRVLSDLQAFLLHCRRWRLAESKEGVIACKSVQAKLSDLPLDELEARESNKQKKGELSPSARAGIEAFTQNYEAARKDIEHDLHDLSVRERAITTAGLLRIQGATMAECANVQQLLYLGDVIEQWVFQTNCDSRRTSFEITDDELPDLDCHLLVTGPAGYGKTSFCRWHALLDAERFQRGSSVWFPVYVPLHRYSKGKLPETMESIVTRHFGNSALLTSTDLNTLRSGHHRLRLYLDGLDEIPDANQRGLLLEMLHARKDSFKGCQVIVTGRDVVFCPEAYWLLRLQLAGLKKQAIEELAAKWLEDASLRAAFLEQMESEHAATEIMKVPLLATLTLLLYRKTRSLPESRSELYRIFMDLLCGGWDLYRGVVRDVKFGKRVKHLVLVALAHRTHARRTKTFKKSDVSAAAATLLNEDLFTRLDAVLDELLLDGIIQRAGNEMQFSHLSFQEYLTAQALFALGRKDEVRRVIVNAARGDAWWLDVCLFYISECPDPQYINALIRKAGGSDTCSRRLRMALAKMIPGLTTMVNYRDFVGTNDDLDSAETMSPDANSTSEGIRQPADGLPKPSM